MSPQLYQNVCKYLLLIIYFVLYVIVSFKHVCNGRQYSRKPNRVELKYGMGVNL